MKDVIIIILLFIAGFGFHLANEERNNCGAKSQEQLKALDE